jgi:hypothetical protein
MNSQKAVASNQDTLTTGWLSLLQSGWPSMTTSRGKSQRPIIVARASSMNRLNCSTVTSWAIIQKPFERGAGWRFSLSEQFLSLGTQPIMN